MLRRGLLSNHAALRSPLSPRWLWTPSSLAVRLQVQISPLTGVSRKYASTFRAINELETNLDTALHAVASQAKTVRTSSLSSEPAVLLRDYQQEAISKCLSALDDGLTRIGVSSPTGSGKTTVFMHLIPAVCGDGGVLSVGRQNQAVNALPGPKGKALVLVSGIELAGQTEAAARRILGPEWNVEVEQGSRKVSGRADVTIATIQTLNNVDRLRKFNPKEYDLVIVDEAHHAAALSYLRILHYFNDGVELPSIMAPITTLNHGNRVPIVGFSATFSRPDQLALAAVFEKIVFHREISSMLEDGWLSPATFTAVNCALDLESVRLTRDGDYSASALVSKINTAEINELIVRTYLHKAKDRRSTLIFCVDLSHVDAVTQAFRDAGIDARSVSSESQSTIRRQTLSAFMAGEFPVLVNCQVLTEAADIPCIDCIILARPTMSSNLLAQMVGRGLRLSPNTGKENCQVIDLVDTLSRSNGMLVSPTLWGISHDDLPPDYRRALEEGKSEDAESTGGRDNDQVNSGGTALDRMRVTFVQMDDPFKLHKPKFQPLPTLSHNAWVACGKDRYILELFGEGYIRIEPHNDADENARDDHDTASPDKLVKRFNSPDTDETTWAISYRPKLVAELRRFTPPLRRVAQAATLERAIQTGDRFAEKRIGRELMNQLTRYAPWRRRSASPKALEAVKKLKRGAEIDEQGGLVAVMIGNKRVEVEKLTAGEVASYLCAATHGAFSERRRADSIERTAAKRLAKRAEKARALAQRNLPLPPS